MPPRVRDHARGLGLQLNARRVKPPFAPPRRALHIPIEREPLDNDLRQSPPEFMCYPAASRRLGVTIKWLRNAVAEGRVPHYKMGRLVRFRPADLDEFAERCRVEAREVIG